MKMLKIVIEYGDLMIPKQGVPFVDSSEATEVVTMTGPINKLDGDKLGRELFDAIGRIAKENPE